MQTDLTKHTLSRSKLSPRFPEAQVGGFRIRIFLDDPTRLSRNDHVRSGLASPGLAILGTTDFLDLEKEI